jgi:hypothetical protein
MFFCFSSAKDTCQAMDEWAQHPRAETALSNILPCVDESTTNRTLYQSKYVVVQLVSLVNKAISVLSNRKQYHLHPGRLMPSLCTPYDSKLNDRQCLSREVTFDNATTVSAILLLLRILSASPSFIPCTVCYSSSHFIWLHCTTQMK